MERYHIPKRDRIRKHSFIVDHKYRIALCLHPKAGTTTWNHLIDGSERVVDRSIYVGIQPSDEEEEE